MISLRATLREHGGVIEYDLLKLGLDLRLIGTSRLSWRRMAVLVPQIAADPTSSLYRVRAGDLVDWTLQTQLAALTANAVRVLAWQNTEDGQNKSPKHYPEPIRPPIEAPVAEATVSTGQLLAFRQRTAYARRSSDARNGTGDGIRVDRADDEGPSGQDSG